MAANAQERSRLSSKGQVVIPKALRDRLGLSEGDEVVFHLVSDKFLVLEVPEPSPLEAVMASLRDEAARRGITREDIERDLARIRQENYREWRAAREAH